MEKNHYENERADFYKNFSKFSKIEHMLVTIPLMHVLKGNLGDFTNKKWLDYWCWNWFVTDMFHKKWTQIIGVDNSIDQIQKAKIRERNWLRFIHISNNDISCIEDESLDFAFFRFSTCEMDDVTLHIVLSNVERKIKKWWSIAIGDQNRESCIGHETMDVCYPFYKKKLLEWEATITMLKKHGIKYIGNESKLVENLDYMPITDHYRSKWYMKDLLEKNGFNSIVFNEKKLNVKSQLPCFDEKKVAMYKITSAKK